MKSLFISVIAMLFVGTSATAQEADVTVICNDTNQCAQTAKSILSLNADRGLSGCGVVPGEKVVKYVDSEGRIMGYACVWTSGGGLF